VANNIWSGKLSQLHIDAVRNSTDDFNPFHDPYKWRSVKGNPFTNPIALGFQLEALAAYYLELRRNQSREAEFITEHQLCFTNIQTSFAGVVYPEEVIQLEIRDTKERLDPSPQLSNRFIIRKGREPVLIGYQRESTQPSVTEQQVFSSLGDLAGVKDRSFIGGGSLFLKRKFMNNSNAKNFLLGSMVDQHYYFDELEGRVNYPGMFPVALISCALLEKAHQEDYDFYRNPMVYTSHEISIDRSLLAHLRSNDQLNLLVQGPEPLITEGGLGKSAIRQARYRCYGVVQNNELLFRASVNMALLRDVIGAVKDRSKLRETLPVM